jgi:DNA-binding SARP family transcriptional activator
MEPSLPFDQGTLTIVSEISSPAILLESGIHCTRKGHYVEGMIYFTRARERLSADQMDFAAALDAFIQSHARYLQAQEALHTTSRHFVEADTEQQTQLVALEKLLLTLREEADRAPMPHAIVQPTKDSWEYQSPQSLQLPSADSNFEQPSLLHSFPKDCDILPALYFTCFGRFEVRRLGQSIRLCSSRSGQSILRYLVAQPGHRATSDTLQTLLWPEEEPEASQNKLHLAISALRRSLNHGCTCKSGCGYIVCKNQVYHLNPTAVVQTDLDEFLQCYQAGRRTNEERIDFYERACRLYTGPFLPEDRYADWSFLQREQLSRAYLAMCRVLSDHYLKIKQYEDASKWATAILQENHCDEWAYRQLMLIYAAQGCRSEALQQYQRCQFLLCEELGVHPSPETAHVFQSILAHEPPSYQEYSENTAKVQRRYSPS